MVGATVIESDDAGPVTVRSALELLGSAYALHPAFAEAEIVDMAPACAPRSPTTCRRSSCAAARSTSTASTATASCWRRCWPSLVADYLDAGAIDNRVFVMDQRI